MQVESFLAKKNLPGKVKPKKGNGKNEMRLGLLKKKSVTMGGGMKVALDFYSSVYMLETA